MYTDNTRTTIRRGNGTTTLPEQEPGACRPTCAAAHRGTDWARRLSVCKAHGGYANKAGPSCCTFETATSVLALPYGQAPNPCHPAPSRARRRGTGCCNGSAPPSGELTPSVCASGVSSPSTSTFAPRISAADRPDRRKPTPGGRQAQHSACACGGDLPRRAGLPGWREGMRHTLCRYIAVPIPLLPPPRASTPSAAGGPRLQKSCRHRCSRGSPLH